jgi:hypothetical protein
MSRTRSATKREHDEAGVAFTMISKLPKPVERPSKLPKPVERPEYAAAKHLLHLWGGVW